LGKTKEKKKKKGVTAKKQNRETECGEQGGGKDRRVRGKKRVG